MKKINNIIYTGLIIFVLVILWFVNVELTREDTLPRAIITIIFNTPPFKVATTIVLLIALFGIWYEPPSEENN
jgi:hypothetical protein